MEKIISNTIDYLESKLKETEEFKNKPINSITLGKYLCGENWELIKEPFSAKFLTNVAFNSKNSMQAILLAQLIALE
jgi:hypothetical protein